LPEGTITFSTAPTTASADGKHGLMRTTFVAAFLFAIPLTGVQAQVGLPMISAVTGRLGHTLRSNRRIGISGSVC